jgi:hypothetical protein
MRCKGGTARPHCTHNVHSVQNASVYLGCVVGAELLPRSFVEQGPVQQNPTFTTIHRVHSAQNAYSVYLGCVVGADLLPRSLVEQGPDEPEDHGEPGGHVDDEDAVGAGGVVRRQHVHRYLDEGQHLRMVFKVRARSGG